MAVDLFANSTCSPPRKRLAHSRQTKFWVIFLSAYANTSDALHDRKCHSASPKHMTRPPSSILTSTCRPCDNSDHDSGNLTCALISHMPCARSIPFPTAAILRCGIGNSHPANNLWKKAIAAKYPLTVDCRLLCTKQRDAKAPSRSDSTSVVSAKRVQPRFFTLRLLAYYPGVPLR